MRSRLCRVCSGFHDLEVPWPPSCYGHFGAPKASSGIQIIKDIAPYQAVAVDARTGKVPHIGSRREHREFLKANNYREVGNEQIQAPPPVEIAGCERDIKQAIDHIKDSGRWK